MASKFRNVPVKMVRIQWSDRKQPITHKENVAIGMPKDTENNTTYLRIVMIISEELHHFQWLDESSSIGVATITTSSVKIVILYNSQDKTSCEFFDEMEAFLKPDHIELATRDLIRFINEGSGTDAERAAEYLAKSRAKIQFNLNNTTVTKKVEAEASNNVLQLTLRIECHLNRSPLIKTIYVPTGTTLRTLKEEIENQTGIERKSQFWYAFDRYIIDDNYQFGSQDPVVPPRRKNTPLKEALAPTDPIRSGDTLIMYIAQISTYK
ncbi:unnamed protein product [Rotaria sp. Silwood1]|nr:unnamed protein product [Rotaria sp. Silwood1]CAF0971059.1 unnamed protein product [Rotaria sp. Silwood1]CAF3383019.1 unnamed protein product [Rotaria sp. Silwood1]CAF4590328.1 unnamed protein product [Rotaria sp. Silwood1]